MHTSPGTGPGAITVSSGAVMWRNFWPCCKWLWEFSTCLAKKENRKIINKNWVCGKVSRGQVKWGQICVEGETCGTEGTAEGQVSEHTPLLLSHTHTHTHTQTNTQTHTHTHTDRHTKWSGAISRFLIKDSSLSSWCFMLFGISASASSLCWETSAVWPLIALLIELSVCLICVLSGQRGAQEHRLQSPSLSDPHWTSAFSKPITEVPGVDTMWRFVDW